MIPLNLANMTPLDIATMIGFAASSLLVLITGLTIVRTRQRVRNIADVGPRLSTRRAGAFRRSLAGAIPAMSGELESLERDLKRAGFYGPNSLIEFLAARNLVVVFYMIVGGTLAILAPPTTQLPKLILWITLGAIVVAYVLPRIIVSVQAKSRLARIQKGLPDALDIVRMCLSGGLALRDSLYKVSQEIEFFHPDMAVELEVVRRHAEADTMTKALHEFSNRMDADDVNALASLVSQTEKTGTHVAEAVTEFSDGMRRQSKQRAEERANKTTIKMLFPVVLCLAPPILVLLLAPPMLEMRSFFRDAHNPGGVLDAKTITEQAGTR